jgi:DNA-binding transcriptional ArsR family regulator
MAPGTPVIWEAPARISRPLSNPGWPGQNSLPNGKQFAMVHHMENHLSPLDAAFHALSDPTRRAVLNRLVKGPAPVSELAQPFAMGMPAFLKHLRVLEADGMVTSHKAGRVRTCAVNADRLAVAEAWLAGQRALWQASADRLADYVETHMTRTPDNAD